MTEPIQKENKKNKKERSGHIYIEFTNRGRIAHKVGFPEYTLEAEYRRILKEISERRRPYITLTKGHIIVIDKIVEIWIRYD